MGLSQDLVPAMIGLKILSLRRPVDFVIEGRDILLPLIMMKPFRNPSSEFKSPGK